MMLEFYGSDDFPGALTIERERELDEVKKNEKMIDAIKNANIHK